MEMARSLLKSMNVPRKLWGEAVRHSVYLLNRLPTKAMSEKTPFEVWWGRKPNLGCLKVFGCTAHVRTTGPHLKKLEDRSRPMVYLGVDEGCKAHRLLDVINNKIIVSRDIICEEAMTWDWSKNSVEDVSTEFVVENELRSWSHGVGGMIGGEDAQQTVPESGGALGSSGSGTPTDSAIHNNILPD